MTTTTVNVHIHADDEFTVAHTTYDTKTSHDTYVSFEIEGVTFFVRDAAQLFAIAAEAATAAAELMHAQAEARRELKSVAS